MDQYIQEDHLAPPRFKTSSRRLRGNHNFIDVEQPSPSSNSSDVLDREDVLGSPPDDVLPPIGLMSDHCKYEHSGSESSYETFSRSSGTELIVNIDRDTPDPCLVRTNLDSLSHKGGLAGSKLPLESDPTKIVNTDFYNYRQTDVEDYKQNFQGDENVHVTNSLETGSVCTTAADCVVREGENQSIGLGSQCSGYDSSEMEM